MSTVVVGIKDGEVSVEFSSPDVDVCVFDLDKQDIYLYKDNIVCSVYQINDDGTVDIKCLDTLDGSPHNRSLRNVPACDLSYYSSSEDFDETD